MNARTAARELTLMLFAQLKKNTDALTDKLINETLLKTVRTLVSTAENDLKLAVGALVETRNFIDNYELEHPNNVQRPIDSENVPVPIPLTSDMSGRLNELLEVAEKSFDALEAAELAILEEKASVKKYILEIMEKYNENKPFIDSEINEYAQGWNIERFLTVDKNILRIAVTELLYISSIPSKVSADEAVELAKKYGSDESAPFINGILGRIIKENKLEKKK